jgi:hypothetical protein
LVHAVQGLAMVAQRRGALTPATHLWAAGQALINAWNTKAPFVSDFDDEAAISDLCTRLGEKVFAVAWTEGSAMQLDEVLEEALAI